jgi:symplekin
VDDNKPAEGFSLDDLPAGHPIITQEDLESIAEYAFTTLRGLALMGGQVKIDVNMLSDMMLTSGGNNESPAALAVSILKPAALAFLDVDSLTSKQASDENILSYKIDRSNVEFDFLLSQKPYAIAINAMSAVAMNRPDFFKDAAITVARRAVDPPLFHEGGPLDKSGATAITSHLKATCLTLLRNPLSVTTDASTILQNALEKYEMEIQAEKALAMANQAISLLSAGRAARNRANMFYQWDSSETDRRSTKRQRETDDALAKMRAAKAARGLGNGIQLPTSMSDAIELILLNLSNLPKQPVVQKAATKSRVAPVSLQYVIDAIMSQGASLVQEEGRWYDRDGGTAWSIDINSDQNYDVNPKLVETLLLEKTYSNNVKDEKEGEEGKIQRRRLFYDQCKMAASDSVGRILTTSCNTKSKAMKDLCSRLVARLAYTLENIKPSNTLQSSYSLAKECTETLKESETDESFQNLLNQYPLAATSLVLEASTQYETAETTLLDTSLNVRILNEALVDTYSEDQLWKYDKSLETYVASVVRASSFANEKIYDTEKKNIAAQSAANLRKDIVTLPRLTKAALVTLCGMCDIQDITKKANEASRRGSQESAAYATASHAAKLAAEKRAQAVLLTLRDIAFQRDEVAIRKSAVQCAVSLASGHLPSSLLIQDQALKLTMNILFMRNEALADFVVDAAIEDFELASTLAIEHYETIQKANKDAEAKNDSFNRNPLAPRSDEEKKYFDQMRWHALLAMAVCNFSRCSLFRMPCF